MKQSIITILGLGLALAATPAFANTTVEPVVVTAKRFKTTIDTAPVNITVITAEDIRKSKARNLSQVLELQAGVYVKDQFGITGSKSSVDIGGFGANGGHNTLVLINGRRQNDVDLSGANLASVPLESIARIEIIHGSSTVLYGDNAVSGVVNIVTKSGFEQDRANVSGTAGSFNTRELDASYSKTFNDTAFYIAADIFKSDGYRDRNKTELANLVTELSQSKNNWDYGVRLNSFDEKLQLPGALNEPEFLTNPTAASVDDADSKQRRHAIDFFVSSDLFAAELAYSTKDQEAFGTTEAELNTLSFTPRIKQTIANHQLIAGIDLYNSDLDTKADFGSPFGFPMMNQSTSMRDSYALYATDNFQIFPASNITLGLRRQWVDLKIENTDLSSGAKTMQQREDAESAWEIGFNHQFNNLIQAYVRWADSFRFPVLDEMYDYSSGTITPLKPQTGHHVETGATFTLTNSTTLAVNVFRITLENEIAYISYDGISTSNINLPDPTKHEGVDINLNSQIKQWWQLALGYGYREATFRSGTFEGNKIPEVPENKATWTNIFKLNDQNHFNLDAVYTGSRYFGNDFANVGKKMPGYTLVNLGYTYRVKKWKAQFRIDNVADRNAADQGFYGDWMLPDNNPYFYYPLPGRAYYLTLGAEF